MAAEYKLIIVQLRNLTENALNMILILCSLAKGTSCICMEVHAICSS